MSWYISTLNKTDSFITATALNCSRILSIVIFLNLITAKTQICKSNFYGRGMVWTCDQ